jgi:transcriptional regulator with XRE-family HTH domain
MSLTIGLNIKKLRTKGHFTQEQLAAYLGISTQAVSRWETQNGDPDLALLPRIADFFSVTVDDLFGIDRDGRAARMEEMRRQVIRTLNSSSMEEGLSLLRKAAAEYPSEVFFQIALADHLLRYALQDPETPDIAACREAERLYLALRERTDNPHLRDVAITGLARLHAHGYGDTQRASRFLDELPTVHTCRELAKLNVLSGEELQKARQLAILRMTEMLGQMLPDYIAYHIPNERERFEEKIDMLHRLIDLYDLIFGEDKLHYHRDVSTAYHYIATYTVALEQREETLTALEEMCRHAIAADRTAFTENAHFTSPFLDMLKSHTVFPMMEDIPQMHMCHTQLDKLTQDRYDPVRDDPRFRAVEETLRTAIDTMKKEDAPA